MGVATCLGPDVALALIKPGDVEIVPRVPVRAVEVGALPLRRHYRPPLVVLPEHREQLQRSCEATAVGAAHAGGSRLSEYSGNGPFVRGRSHLASMFQTLHPRPHLAATGEPLETAFPVFVRINEDHVEMLLYELAELTIAPYPAALVVSTRQQ